MTATVSSSLRQPVDPGMAAVLDGLPPLTFDQNSLPEMRDMLAALAPADPPDGVEVTEYQIDAGPTLRVLRRAAPAAGPVPCVYWMHGGGFVIGNRMMDDTRLGDWVRELGCVAVSVEYRLAPDHPYPTPLDDCYAGLAWVHEHASDLGVDETRVGVAGLSAGGGLAAGLALLARDRGEFALSFQLLDSPMLDDRQATPSSRATDLVLWNRESNRFGWKSYLGALYDGDSITEYAAPDALVRLGGPAAHARCRRERRRFPR